MIYEKTCLHCHGDLGLVIDDDVAELRCFQCGFFIDQKRANELLDRLQLPRAG